jgi:hypothetical protein
LIGQRATFALGIGLESSRDRRAKIVAVDDLVAVVVGRRTSAAIRIFAVADRLQGQTSPSSSTPSRSASPTTTRCPRVLSPNANGRTERETPATSSLASLATSSSPANRCV